MKPGVLSISSLYPDAAQPLAGVFVRERLSRLAACRPVTVLAPVPWFPGQSLIRLWRPGFRAAGKVFQESGEMLVLRPRYLSVPGLFKQWDGALMALCCLPWLWWLRRTREIGVLDAHFGYPEGYAASLLSRWSGLPFAVTLRGTELRHSQEPRLRRRLSSAFRRAALLIGVSDSLRKLAVELGGAAARSIVVGNGVDARRFRPLDRAACRADLDLPAGCRVLITVGGLVERKGFHRVIELLPLIRSRGHDVRYLVVGGASAEGDYSATLREITSRLGLEHVVHFIGPMTPDQLPMALSAADLFVLPTSNEGWANVLLEAMACGLPVVTTDRGGNREVVNDAALGTIVPFGDATALQHAIESGLTREWDRAFIIAHAQKNGWSGRIAELDAALASVMR